MTVTTATSRIEYAGDGSTTAFSVPFYFLANGDLKVYQADTLKTITTHYTVTGAGNPAGGTVTFVAAPGSSDDVVIYRDPAITQSTDYVENDPFPAESHETALDRLTMIAQRSRDLLTRAVRLPDSEADAASMTLPEKASRLSHVIGFDTLGNLTTYTAQAGTSLIDLAASTGSDLIGFIQSGTGAVLRTAQDKMRETVSVLDFGASPSETGANNATSIQSAFNSGASAIYVPSGTYDIGANTLTLPQNCLVYGDGDSSTIVSSGGVLPIATLIGTSGSHKSGLTLRDIKLKRTNGVASGSLVRFVYADDCSIEGVTFDGNDAAYPGSVVGESVLRLLVDSCEFVGGTSLNLTSEGAVTGNPWSQDCVVRNCYLAPAAWQGFDFYYVKNLIVDGCIANGRTSTYGCGFIIEYEATNVTFTNCISYNNTRSGFYYEPNVAYGLASVTFNNCIAYGNGETGLYAQNASGLTIHGGAYWGSTGAFVGSVGGISFVGNVLNTSVTGVYIHSNQVNGLLLGACNSVAICNNIFYNNNGNAINVSGVSVEMRLAGNTFNSNTTNITGWVEYQSGTDLDGVWASWSPTWYKADNATVLTVSAQSCKYKRIGNTVHYSVYANISGTPDAVTYFTIPITGAWANGATTDDARRFRGSASGAATAYSEVTGIYSNTRLRITHTAAGDTFIGAQGTYEVA